MENDKITLDFSFNGAIFGETIRKELDLDEKTFDFTPLSPNFMEYLMKDVIHQTEKEKEEEKEIYDSSPVFQIQIKQLKTSSSKRKFPKEAREIIFDWLCKHIDKPYPSTSEYKKLEAKTGLSEKQIRIFLTNHRSRFLGLHPKGGKDYIKKTSSIEKHF